MKDGISAAKLDKLKKLIAAGEGWRFYSWNDWRGPEGIRETVIKIDHCQCYYCRRPLRRRSAIVHHVRHLDEAPELALSIYAPDGSRQLVTVCKNCHELQHPEAMRPAAAASEAVTVERWD